MKQAKVLTVAERKRLLAIIANDRRSERNRLAVMLSFLAGLRVGEIAALRVSNVVDGEGRVREKLVKIGAKVVRHGRYVTFQLAEVAVPRNLFQKILNLINDLRRRPAPA